MVLRILQTFASLLIQMELNLWRGSFYLNSPESFLRKREHSFVQKCCS